MQDGFPCISGKLAVCGLSTLALLDEALFRHWSDTQAPTTVGYSLYLYCMLWPLFLAPHLSPPSPQSSIRRLFTCSSEPRVQDKALIAPPPVGEAVDDSRGGHRVRSLERAFAAASAASVVIDSGGNNPLATFLPTVVEAATAAATFSSVTPPQLEPPLGYVGGGPDPSTTAETSIGGGHHAMHPPLMLGAGGRQSSTPFPSAAQGWASQAREARDALLRPSLTQGACGRRGSTPFSSAEQGWDSHAREALGPPPLMLGGGGRQGSTPFSSAAQGDWSYDEITLGGSDDGGVGGGSGSGGRGGGSALQRQGLCTPRGTMIGGSDDGGVGGSDTLQRRGPCSPPRGIRRLMMSVSHGSSQSASQLDLPGLHPSVSVGVIRSGPPYSPPHQRKLSAGRPHAVTTGHHSHHHHLIDRKSEELRTHALIKMLVAPTDQVRDDSYHGCHTSCIHTMLA